MKYFFSPCVAVALALIAGCANVSETTTPTPEALRDKTAGNLGFAPTDVKISGMRDGNGVTYFVASTPKATYGCSIPSGGLTAYATMGMVNLQPTCVKQ